MLFRNWLRNLQSRSELLRAGNRLDRQKHRSTRDIKLRLEWLEDRTVPSSLTVTNTLDDGSAGSLRYEIAQANTDAAAGVSDAINFDSSLAGATIVLTQGQLELAGAGGGTITIDGSSLNNPITVSGNNVSRVLQVYTGVQAELDHLALENGNGFDGGGCILNSGTMTISGILFSGNYGPNGGAIMNFHGMLSVADSTFTGNSAGTGGAIDGPASISGCTFSGNTAQFAGGAFSGTGSITGCTFSGNSAYFGGAIAGSASISGCTFSGNTAQWRGGAIDGPASISGCTFSGNTAQFAGGAFSGTGSITGCTFSGNFAGGGVGTIGGGAIDDPGGTLTVRGCSLSGNLTNIANAIYNHLGGTMTVNGCTLTGNGSTDANAFTIINEGIATVIGSSLSDNFAAGIWNTGTGTLTVSGSTVCGNFDGGIANGGTLTVIDSTLSSNAGTGIFNYGTLTVTGSTLAGNYYTYTNLGDIKTDGGAIENRQGGTVTVNGCTLSGNSAAVSGGGIFNAGTATISGSVVSGNSAAFTGGGIFNASSGSIMIQNESTTDFYGIPTFDINSATYNNQAPTGADLENQGTLNINHSAIANVDNQNSGATTSNVAATDTATFLTSSVNPSLPGQAVLNVQVLAAQAGTPTGTVTFYDGNNAVLGSATLNGGLASLTISLEQVANGPIHAVYSGDGSFFTGSTSAPVVQTVVDAQTLAELQDVINRLATSSSGAGVQVTLDANSFYSSSIQPISSSYAQDVANVIAQVNAPAGSRVVITFKAPQNNYGDLMLSTQQNVSLVINFANGTQVVGNSPALLVTAGDVTVANATFTTATDAPTILVTGGHLTLRNDIVQESTGYSDAAIAVTGGSLDLGTPASPGGNTIDVNGTGQVIASTGLNVITAVGNTFQTNGSAVFPVATTSLVSSANPALLNQPVSFIASVSAPNTSSPSPTGTVTFLDLTSNSTLGSVSLSGSSARLTVSVLGAGTHTIAAVYSGDANYITSSSTLIQKVNYHFSSFLAPLNSNLAFGVNRTIPIKFQLTDYNNKFITSLSAVTSLQVLNGQGQNVLTNAGSTVLRYDSTSNQFIANWQTKGLPAGNYTVTLGLADGTSYKKTIQLSANGAGGALLVDGTNATTTAVGALLGGNIELYVDNSNGDLTADELARVQDAVTAVDAVTVPYGVVVAEVTDPTLADATLNMNATSAVGGYADGVLGCTTDAGQITIIAGWNFYAGSDVTQVGSAQFDFETVVIHELGHALGLGHSANSASVMFATLNAGTANRVLAVADLNVPDSGTGGACGLHADSVGRISNPSNGINLFEPATAGFADVGQHSSADGSMTSQDWNPDPQATQVGRISNPSYRGSTTEFAIAQAQWLETNASAGLLSHHGPLNLADADDFWSSFAATRLLTNPLTGMEF